MFIDMNNIKYQTILQDGRSIESCDFSVSGKLSAGNEF